MKFLALLFLVGYASASFYDALDEAADEVVADFMLGMERAPSLSDVMGMEYAEEAEEIDQDTKTELGKALRESLNHVLERIRDAVDHGKEVGQELVDKAKGIADKLKEMKQDAGSKAKDLLAKIKEKSRDWVRKLLEKIGIGKRGLNDLISSILEQFNIKNLLQKLKEKIAEKVNIEQIIEYIKKVFGERSQIARALLETLKQKGVDALKSLVSRILPSDQEESAYSIAESWNKIKDFFKGLGVQIREKFSKFADWLKVTVKSGFNEAKDKATKLKEIARTVIDHSKEMSKEVAQEALDFFQPYKEDLGSVWDELKEAVKKAIGKSE